MRRLLSILTMLMMVWSVSAAYNLNAILIGSNQLSITNCKPAGGAYQATASFNIDNPISEQVNVYYEWYDFPTGTFREGGKVSACTINPGFTKTCAFILGCFCHTIRNFTFSTVIAFGTSMHTWPILKKGKQHSSITFSITRK